MLNTKNDNMRKLGYLLVVLVLTVVGCKSDEDKSGELAITFKAVYDNDPLVLNTQEVWYHAKETMTFSNLNMFLSDLSLSTASENVELSDIEFVDFQASNRDEMGAETGVTLRYEVDPGNYTALNLGLGVSSDLNAMAPSDFDNDHPLAQFGSFWTAWNSFIFSKTEGRIDSDGDDVPDLGFVYHIGADQMYRSVSANGNIEVTDGGTTEITVYVDYKRVFGTANDYIDILSYPAFHSPQDSTLNALTQALADNFAQALTIEMK